MKKELKDLVINILNERLQPAFILVFGSYANGTAREESDLDLAYYSNKTLNSYERFILAGEIASKCNINIDLVDVRQVDTVFAAQIFYYGELLACTDENTFVKERMKAFSMYVTLNEQRKEILQSIEERGSVYGE